VAAFIADEFRKAGLTDEMPSYEVLLSYPKSARLTIVGEPEVRLGRPEEPIASDPELVKTSFEDSQVMYWEPAKYVARLRAKKTDQNPLLFKVNMAGGHGGSGWSPGLGPQGLGGPSTARPGFEVLARPSPSHLAIFHWVRRNA
jgi:hypothetical protein